MYIYIHWVPESYADENCRREICSFFKMYI